MWTTLALVMLVSLAPAAGKKKPKAKAKAKAAVTATTPAPGATTDGGAATTPKPEPEPAPAATLLLADADRARGGLKEGVTWLVELNATEDGDSTSRTYLVKARGDDCIAEATAPARTKGELMLFNDRTLWFVKPGVRKPVSISARQKLSGDAANGDIASTQYARDYEGTVVGDDTVGEVPTWKLELKARATNVTYDRIRYWISKTGHLGLKAEFLTVGGEVFKTATFEYGNKLKTGGGEYDFVSTMTIRDPATSNTTLLKFGTPRAETHPPTIFNVNNLVR